MTLVIHTRKNINHLKTKTTTCASLSILLSVFNFINIDLLLPLQYQKLQHQAEDHYSIIMLEVKICKMCNTTFPVLGYLIYWGHWFVLLTPNIS